LTGDTGGVYPLLKYFGKLQAFVYANFTRFGKKYRVQLRGEPRTAKCDV